MKRLYVVRPAIAVSAGLIFSAGSHAQSSVSLYGIVDSGLIYLNKTSGNSGKLVGFNDSGNLPSLFGMTGSEDLGGGSRPSSSLKAVSTLPMAAITTRTATFSAATHGSE